MGARSGLPCQEVWYYHTHLAIRTAGDFGGAMWLPVRKRLPEFAVCIKPLFCRIHWRLG